MNQLSTYENDLITRYLSGEATGEEIKHLSEWLKQDPENRKIFEELRGIWEKVDHEIVSQIDVDEEWGKFEMKISGGFARRPQSFFSNRYLRIAAILLLILIPAWFIIRYINAPDEMEMRAYNGILEKELPDGSNVALNAGSSMTYLAMRGHERNVKLNGEAYFRVAHDQKRPFIISGNDTKIEVLGTSFLVNTATPEGNIEVVLDTGRVAIYRNVKNPEKVYLEPGQKAIIRGEVISIISNNDRNYMSWKTRKLVFEDDSLPTVIRTLQNVYGTSISLSGPYLASCRLTATFDHQSSESVLNVLKETLSLSLEKNNNGYLLTGKGCR